MRIKIDFSSVEYQTTKTLAKAYDMPFTEDTVLTHGAPMRGGLLTAFTDSKNHSIDIELSEVLYVKVCLLYIAHAKPFSSLIRGIKDMVAASGEFIKDMKEINDYVNDISKGYDK